MRVMWAKEMPDCGGAGLPAPESSSSESANASSMSSDSDLPVCKLRPGSGIAYRNKLALGAQLNKWQLFVRLHVGD